MRCTQYSSYASRVSRFSNRLRDLIETVYLGNSAKFAEAAGLGQSTVSRLLRDLFQAHAETIATIATHLPADQSAPLCAAWLEDMVPPQLIYAIRIGLSQEPSASILREPLKSPWQDLDLETRSALDHLAKLAIQSADARNALVSTANYLRGDPVLTPEAETAVEIAKDRARKAKPSTRK